MLATLVSGRMLVATIMGFASGLPLLLTISVLQAWMHEEGVDLGTIGLFVLVGLPYTFKFVWAPFLDRYTLPLLGRRRGWLLLAQLFLIGSIVFLAGSDPGVDPAMTAFAALLLTFFSATQDIVVDAYRRESLADDEQGSGAALYFGGYRVGMLLASGGGLILADFVPFPTVYLIMAAIMLIGVVTTILAPEPPEPEGTPTTLAEAVIEPLVDYFKRHGAVLMLLFIVLYKVGDMMASIMTTPFYLDMGFSKAEIGAIVKLFGFMAIPIGSVLGAVLILRLGLYRSLWGFGILQAVSTAGFALLAQVGYSLAWLAAVIAFENFTMAMGTAALLAFMANLTNKRFTAAQFALLSALSSVPRTILAAPSGFMADSMGWFYFFSFCALVAIPGLLLLTRFRSWLEEEGNV